jgi:hypothetical protein
MTDAQQLFRPYSDEVRRLVGATSTTEETYYPAIKGLLARALEFLHLPFEARTSTSEARAQRGIDLPDFALYDGPGEFLVVCGEVKLPDADLRQLAFSEERNNQIGRYLAQTGAVLVSNVRGFGLVTIRPGTSRENPIAPADRNLERAVEFWPSANATLDTRDVAIAGINDFLEIVETAATRYAAIAEPESLAKVLARQARQAKEDLPTEFSQAIAGLAEDFGKALGITFEGPEGEEFFRSSLVQTIFYGLFAGWTIWVRTPRQKPFQWEDLGDYLKIPFLGELFYEFRHPRRIRELGLKRHLDLATETLARVDIGAFFSRFRPPTLDAPPDTSAAIIYFYEPFLEAFDPELRKELGVWYTPVEVVRYQVRKVDRLLREELGCDRGFADERVVALDPCCGTGAYLLEIVRCIADQLRSEGVGGLLGSTLLDILTRRVLGFEILTAPFVISHLQVYLLLSELGIEPAQGQRPAVFLTNALTGWDGPEQLKLHFPELQAEHDAAQEVKRGTRIIVVIGNPPYNRFAGVPIAEEAVLVDHYKGITRDDRGRQVGSSELYTRWGIRKQLLDDLYIRFFRLAERCIGERAEHGVVSFISNYSLYTHRSHPIMRESLLRSFDHIWLDVLNGDKYKTGKVIPRGLPGEGSADQSIFTTTNDPRGIQVGTGITTLLKSVHQDSSTAIANVYYRNFWGKSQAKRTALLAALDMDNWPAEKLSEAVSMPAGPRPYEEFTPTEEKRWKLVPFESQGGFEDWPALDEIFGISIQGVNPNRGLQGSVVDMSAHALEQRMRDYFSDLPDTDAAERHPTLFTTRARYKPFEVRTKLRETTAFATHKVVPYVVFPLDCRWLYYETAAKLLNEARADLSHNLRDNEFLVCVPEPRQYSEIRPLLLTCAFDLHVHDRGSICFPVEVNTEAPPSTPLFGESAGTPVRIANLHDNVWTALAREWELTGTLADPPAKQLARQLAALTVAICHSPAYESEHKDSLAQDWAHVPIPKDLNTFNGLAAAGAAVATLLDPLKSASSLCRSMVGDALSVVGVVESIDGSPIRAEDLVVQYSFFGAAAGGWRRRPANPGEMAHDAWGASTGDLFINERIRLRNVPEAVWTYELGGYPVIKKWLGYRDRGRRGTTPLSVEEINYLREMVHRIAALLVLHSRLDTLYEAASTNSYTIDELKQSPSA